MGKNEKKALRREMGMIFQSAALFDSMTVLDNVMFPFTAVTTNIPMMSTNTSVNMISKPPPQKKESMYINPHLSFPLYISILSYIQPGNLTIYLI